MGKNEQALNVLARYHANGDINDELVQWEYHEVQSAIQQEESVQSSYLEFLRTAGNRRRLMVIVSISVGTNWVGNSLVSFYLAPILRSVGVTDPVKIASINAGLAIWNLTIAVSAGTQVERFGRRPLFLTSFIGMFCSYAVVMGLSATFATQKNTTAGLAAVPFLFIFYGKSMSIIRGKADIQAFIVSPSTPFHTPTPPKSFRSLCEPKVLLCSYASRMSPSRSISSSRLSLSK